MRGVDEERAMKKPKPKKRPPAVIVDPPPSWNLGRSARLTVTDGTPTPAFLRTLIVKKGN